MSDATTSKPRAESSCRRAKEIADRVVKMITVNQNPMGSTFGPKLRMNDTSRESLPLSGRNGDASTIAAGIA